MKIIPNLLFAIVMMLWIVSIAIFSIQNIQPLTISFLFWESIQMPAGILLSSCVGLGLLIGVILPSLVRS